jgi:hypothetical protein
VIVDDDESNRAVLVRVGAIGLFCAVMVLGLSATSGAAPPAKGQTAVGQVASATTATATFATNPAAGNTILVFVQTNGTISSVTDNGSTPKAFTRDAFTTAGKGAYIYRANNITLPASGSYKVTVKTADSRTIQLKAIEFAGLAPGPPSATNSGSGTGTAVSTNSVTSGGDTVFFGGFSDNSSQNPQSIAFNSAGAGFAQDFVNANGAAYWPAAQASATASGAATKSISWTIGSSSAWGAVIAAYGVVAAEAPTPVDVMPDLRMGRVNTFSIDTKTIPGHTLLRFSAMITNVGPGAFEVYGSRPSTSETNMSVQQRVYQSSGGYRTAPTGAVMYYAGDGHNHWHLRNLEGAQLTDASGNVVGAYAKIGFCFSDNGIYDSSVPGAPSTAAYAGCANFQPDALTVRAGLSPGWGDWYPASIAYQWIDITGVPYGTYKFSAFADPKGFFLETSKDNNSTWTSVSYDSSGVKALAYGPSARIARGNVPAGSAVIAPKSGWTSKSWRKSRGTDHFGPRSVCVLPRYARDPSGGR